MKLRQTILLTLICFLLTIASFGTVFAEAGTPILQTDESGTYLIGTPDELFAFAELAKTTAEADSKNAVSSARTPLSAKLTADIDLNPGASFTYDRETGLITVAKGEKSCKMGSGMKDTVLGSFHPVYNGLCSQEFWDAETTTDEMRNELTAQMNEKVEALGLKKWTPIGTKSLPYIGSFDGNDHTIDGLYINDETVYYTGLFGVTGNFSFVSGTSDYGEVKNVTVGGHSLIVGYKADTAGATGAIVGMTQFDKIINCTNYATVVGKGSGRLDLSNSGLVGGIVGYANNDVRNCANRGTVVSRESAGGIVGNIMGNQYQQGNIIYCANYGNVYAEAHSDTGYAGGIALNSGVGTGTAAGCGGNVEGCINYGYVEGYYVGGVIYRGSQNTQVKYCANLGKVCGTSFASGVVTFINNGGFTMEGCYNAGTVTALPYKGEGTVTPKVFPLVASVYTSDYYTVKKCYNDETVCPSNGALFREGVEAVNSYGVTTEIFATGEAAYKMGSYDSKGWKQNLPSETYPTAVGTKRVYEAAHYCCHTDAALKEEHKTLSYSNAYGDITDKHNLNADGICTHCGKDGHPPIFTVDAASGGDTLPEAKVGEYFNITIRTSSDAPQPNGLIKATVSETDDTPYTFTNGLSGEAKYHSTNEYYYYNICGTPTEAGELKFTLSATNENGTAKKTFTLKINKADPLKITSNSKLPNATAGASYYWDYFRATTDLDKTWSLKDGSALPNGLTLCKSSYGEYQITGEPTKPGVYTFTLVVTAGGQSAEKTFTLTVLEEGGCKHGNKMLIKATPPTCLSDGMGSYYLCNICGCNIDADGNEILNMDDLKSASDHSDKNRDGKCDFCGKNMPIFKKVAYNGEIVSGGTYIFVTQIGGKYYALETPPEDGYGNFMDICEITPKADGSFDFNELESKGAMMIKTKFAPANGNLDQGTPRYGLNAVLGGRRYNLSDSGPYFWKDTSTVVKYGYRISIGADGAAYIGSVYQSWWSTPETAENGLLRAFDMKYNGKSTKFMSLFGESGYNSSHGAYSGAEMTEYPIFLYRMTYAGKTSGGITFISNDSTGTFNQDAVKDIIELNNDEASLSNAGGIENAVNQTTVEAAIEAVETPQASVTVQIYADITATAATAETDEKGNKTPTSVTYSVTPKITVLGADGSVLSTRKISDSDLNGTPITVTLYANFMPEQIIHYKEDGTKEYFYGPWSPQAQDGAKTFEADNYFLTFTITDFSDIKILKTAEAEESYENSLRYDGKTLTAAVEKNGSYTVAFAGYEKDGKLSFLKTAVCEFKAGDNTVEIPKTVDFSAVDKVFLWKDLTSLQPLCGALDMTAK